jgi:hypothetical protein
MEIVVFAITELEGQNYEEGWPFDAEWSSSAGLLRQALRKPFLTKYNMAKS